MSAAVQQHDRSRSDSLQRMLDLEKKMMHQRTQSLTHDSLTGSILPNPIPQPQPRRFELVPKDGKKAPPPVRNYGPAPAPLFSNPAPSADSSAPKSRKLVVKSHSRTNSAPIGTMERTTQKQVAFAFPPDVEGHGQSPLREAHDRRRQERKDKQDDNREERRGREQAVSKEKPRGRRLSKAPPTSRNPIFQSHSSTEPGSPSKDKRSSSVLGIPITRRDTTDTRNESVDRSRRGRSGSLSSALRGSFEIRRGSYDQTTASGFLGGVKLEKKKQDFTQQVIEDQTQNTSRVHPAFRKSFLGHGSFTPLKTATAQSAPDTEVDKEADAQKRAYPPISIQTSGTMSQASASPKTPIRRDSAGSANIYLWSARATKKMTDPSNECAVAEDIEDDEAEPSSRGITLTDTPPADAKELTGLTRRGGLHIKTSPRAVLTSKFSTDGQEEAPQNGSEGIMPLNIRKSSREMTPESTEPAAPEPQLEKSLVIESKGKVSCPPATVKTRPRRESTASAISNPPAPPRKSSKRSSIVFLARASTAPVEVSKEEHQSMPSRENLRAEKKSPLVTKLTTGKRNATPPSIRYESTMPGVRPTPYPAESPTSPSSKWTFKDTAKSAFSRGESVSGSGSSYQGPISPISSTGSFFKGRNSPVIPSSPLKNETTALASVLPHIDVPPVPKQVSTTPASPQNQPTRPSAEHLSPKRNSAFNQWRPMTSSSDDSSYSDALRSSTGPGTPDTSPPQSDSGYPPRTASGKRQPIQYSPYSSSNNSPELSSSDRFQLSDSPHSSESDVDPVEAAARRVLEAFSHANLHSPTDNRRDLESSEDSTSPSSPQVQPLPRLRHREKSKGRLRTSQTQTVKLSQSTNGVKTTRSTPNLDVRNQHHKKATTPVPDALKNHASRPNPQRGDRVSKMFVICCECKRYHDIPVKLYKTMLNPGGVFEHAETKGFEDRVCMTVKCSWCDHQMSTKCCPGVSGILDIQERMH